MTQTRIGTLGDLSAQSVRISKKERIGTLGDLAPKEKNTGGLLGGAGYILGKAGTGLASIGEGITDLVVGGTLDLIGQDRAAKEIFANSWVGDWNKELDEWYNPSGAMKVVGDISGGIGQSVGFVGTTAVGTLVGVPQLGLVAIGASGAGNAIGDAVRQTGELGVKEYVYGTASGLTEVALEKIVGATLAQGAKLAGKTGAKTVTKQVGSKLGKAALSNASRKDFIRTTVTEAAEEGLEEFLSSGANTLLLNVTGVDKEAKFSPYEAGYATIIASVSGGLMSSVSQGTRNAMNYSRGQKIKTAGNTQTMLNTADYLSKKLHAESGDDRIAPILKQLTNSRAAYEKLKNKDGARASLYLGEMQETVTVLETRAKAYQYSDQFAEKIKAEPSKAEEYAQKVNIILGTNYTAQDVIDNKDVNGIMGVRDILGVMRFAGEYMNESMRKAEMEAAMEAERGEYASEEMQELANDPAPIQNAEPMQAEMPPNAVQPQMPAAISQTDASAERAIPAAQKSEIVDFEAEADKLDAKQEAERQETIVRLKNDRNRTSVLIGHALEMGIDESEYLVTDGQFSEIGKITNLVSKEIVASQFPGEDGKAHFNRNGRVHPSAAARAIAEYQDEIRSKGADVMLVTVMDRAYELDHVTPSDTYNKKHHPERMTKKTDTAKKQTSEEKKKPSEAKGRHALGEESSGKITEGMTDEERYVALKNQRISVSAKVDEKQLATIQESFSITEEKIESIRLTDKKKNFRDIGEKLNIYQKEYSTPHLPFTFRFSKGSMGESVQLQKRHYFKLLKMMTCLDQVVKSAVLVEVHNRNDEGYKTDESLKNVFVLSSGFIDGNEIVPVKLEVKEFFGKKENALYVTIALESIKKDEIVTQAAANNVDQRNAPPSTIIIADIFEKINPIDKDFLKYLPDGFLSRKQKTAKDKAIEEDRAKAEKQKEKHRSSLPTEKKEKNERTAEHTEETEPLTEDAHAEARSLAREYVEGFDFYDPETRENVLEWLESANEIENASEATKRAISTVIAAQTGLRVVFDGSIQGNGFYFATGPRSVLLINPNQEADAIETTLVHELTHAIEGKPLYEPLAKIADKVVKSEEKEKITMRYYAHRLRQLGYIDTNAPTPDDIRRALSLLGEKDRLQLDLLNDEIRDEVRAHVISETLTSEKHIKLYAELSPGMVAKLWGRMRRMGLAFYSISGKGAAYRTARRMQKLYESAVLNKGKSKEWMQRVAGGDDEEEKNTVRARNSVSTEKPSFEIEVDTELARRIEKTEKSKYSAIKEYLIEKFHGQTFSLSDGKQAIMDNRDAQEMAHKADELKTAELSNLKKLVESAMLVSETDRVTHKKFDAFSYYAITVKFNNQNYDILINVGRAKNDGSHHIYDITKNNIKKEESPTGHLPVWSRPVGHAITNDSSINSIPDSEENVNTSSEKNRNSLNTSDPLRYKSTTAELLSEATSYHFGYLPLRIRTDIVDRLHESQFVVRKEADIQKMAKDVADQVMKAMDETLKQSDDPNISSAYELVNALKGYLHSITLTASDKEELRTKLDKGTTALLNRWAKQKNKKAPFSADELAHSIAQEIGEFSSLEGMHPIDALVFLDEAYQTAQKMIKEKMRPITDGWTEAEWDHTHRQIEEKVYHALQASARAQAVAYGKEATRKANEHRADVAEEKLSRQSKSFKIINEIHKRAEEILNKKLGRLQNATVYKEKIFRSSIEKLGSITHNGNLSVPKTVSAFKELQEWYTKENPLLVNLFAEEVKVRIEQIAMNEEGNAFTVDDLIAVRDVLAHLQKLEKDFDKTWKDGKLVEIRPLAEQYIEKIDRDSSLQFSKAADRLLDRAMAKWYRGMFLDPASVMRWADKYEDGFFTETYAEIRRGAIAAEVELAEICKEHDKFMEKHRSYLVDAQKKTVSYGGKKIPLLTAMMLYMTMKREQAWGGLMETGWSYWETNPKSGKSNQVRINGIVTQKTLESIRAAAEEKAAAEAGPNASKSDFAQIFDSLLFEETKLTMEQEQKKLAKLFSATDRQYIEILERAYLKCGDAKERMDMQRLGFTNRGDGYYVPLYRADVDVKKLDDERYLDEVGRISNARFNKSTVKGAKQELLMLPVDYVFRRHVKAVTLYANLADVIESYNRIYAFDIGTAAGMDAEGKAVFEKNPNRPTTVKRALENSKHGWNARNDKDKPHVFEWQDGQSYLNDMIDAIQGISNNNKKTMSFLGKLRSAYAVSALGANPKTMATQFTSLVSATSILDMSSIMSGMTHDTSDVYKYCKLAELRRDDNHAARAAGVMDKVNRVSDFLMSGIGETDNFVIKWLFGACQAQIAKEGKGAIGSEKNKIAAGKLLERVILETQQNALQTERSAAMRSGNEFAKAITMFSADAMKVFGRVYDALAEGAVLRARLKSAKTAAEKAKYKKALDKNKKATAKAVAALALGAIFSALIAMAFRWLYNKEDEEPIETVTVDVLGNMVGGLPAIRDAYSFLIEGYDLEDPTFSTLNDLLTASKDLFAMTESIADGSITTRDVAYSAKQTLFSAALLLGIPARNAYNVVYGLTNRIKPDVAYQIDNLFRKKSYAADLTKALEAEDTEMSSTIISVVLNERIGTNMTSATREEMHRLTALDYDVLPRTVGESVTVTEAGEKQTHQLTAKERKEIKAAYGSMQKNALTRLIESNAYKAMTDEAKAKAISYTDTLCYDTAVRQVTTLETSPGSTAVADAIGTDILALILAYARTAEADVDKNGKTVTGSRRTKVISAITSLGLSKEETLLAIYAAGYTPKDGDVKGVKKDSAQKTVLKYILSLNAGAEAKSALAEMCGFTVDENGKIIK